MRSYELAGELNSRLRWLCAPKVSIVALLEFATPHAKFRKSRVRYAGVAPHFPLTSTQTGF